MRWTISPKASSPKTSSPKTSSPKTSSALHARLHAWSHDSRTIDLIAVIALLAFVLGSGVYLATSFAPQPSTTAFIVPSQSVRW